jgi:hypothetical protein
MMYGMIAGPTFMQGIRNLVEALSAQLTSMLHQDLPDMKAKVKRWNLAQNAYCICSTHAYSPLPHRWT